MRRGSRREKIQPKEALEVIGILMKVGNIWTIREVIG